MFSKYSSLLKICTTVLFISSISPLSQAELVVIVNPENTLTTLSHASVRKIFLRKVKSFPDGTLARPSELESGNERDKFNTKFLKKTESSLSSYWARMLFSGKANPPRQFNSQKAIKTYVASTPDAIGYIDSSNVDSSIKVIAVHK
ncbi:MAG: phosphate ABC transporter substrate-binding protein [Pseudomonadales bacterium]|nr:phosphate ABC transporter substrate-binding protein [Pseudomonadales bacterium]